MDASPAPSPTVMDVLRGDPSRRPAADRVAAPRIRAGLDGLVADLQAAHPRNEILRVGSRDLRRGPTSTDATHPLAQLRGALVGTILRLWSVGVVPVNHFEEAAAAFAASGEESSLVELSQLVGGDDRARLATDVTAHAVTLLDRLGPPERRWRMRTKVTCATRLGGGLVIARDIVDLVCGTATSERAGVALLTVTTSPLDERAERALRYHALSLTLRGHVAPLRAVVLSTANGDLLAADVDDALLRRAEDELGRAIEERWAA